MQLPSDLATSALARLLLTNKVETDRYRVLVDICPMPMFVRDAAGNQLLANKAYLQLVGRELDEVLGHGWLRTLDRSEREKVLKTWDESAHAGIDFAYNNRYVRPNGEIVSAHVRATSMPGNLYAGFCQPEACLQREGICCSFTPVQG